MSNIVHDQRIGDSPPILIVRRNVRLTDQMAKDGGGAGAIIDLSSDQEDVDVPGTEIHGGNKMTCTRNVHVTKGCLRKLEGRSIGVKEEIDERGVVNKGTHNKSKFYIVAKDKGGEDGMVVKKAAGKRELGSNKKSAKEYTVYEKDDEEDVDNEVGVRKRTRNSRLVGEGKCGHKDVSKNDGEKGVGCKVPEVDRIHQRVSLWSFHRNYQRTEILSNQS